MTAGTRRAVAFTNRQGLGLVGILHTPQGVEQADLAVILLSPGVKMRVGPQRLYLKVAELFVRKGIPVLTFDFYGLGDSEGSLDEDQLRDVYNHIEVGRFVDDTVDSMHWLANEIGATRFLLGGLCGGAVTGLLTGQKDPRVAGLLAIGITPVLASRAADPSRYMTSKQLADVGQTYLGKIVDPRSWLRLLTFKSDYRLLWRSLSSRFVRTRVRSSSPTAQLPGDDANPLFPPAFLHMLRTSKPMLLVFGGSDRLHAEFLEKFERFRASPAP